MSNCQRTHSNLEPMSLRVIIFATLAFVAIQIIRLVHQLFIKPRLSNLRALPGPKSKSLLYGNFKEVKHSKPGELHAKWIEEYGPTMSYTGVFNSGRLYTHDTRALSFVLSHPDIFRKPDQFQFVLARVLGKGLIFADGDPHRQQRRLLNPAFSNLHIRQMTPTFFSKAFELRDSWSSLASEKESAVDATVCEIDAMSWLSRVTLDIIGLAGFDYAFNATNPRGGADDFQKAFETAFNGAMNFSVMSLLTARFSILRKLVSHVISSAYSSTVMLTFGVGKPSKRERDIQEAQTSMRRLGTKLLADKKETILESLSDKDEKITKTTVERKDILSLLIRANMSSEVPESARLSDEDILAQIPTFILAGHETTAAALAWCLYAMTRHPDIQCKLRDEVGTVDTDGPTMDFLNSLPYLDAVVRETLRFFPIVPMVMRIATEDVNLPLKTPVTDNRGRPLSEIRVRKGEGIDIPIIALNRSKDIWGDDADQYRPERWENVPEMAHEVPGVWSDLMTFIGGPRSCIGYKFSIIEMKVLIFTLIRAFSFEPSESDVEILQKTTFITKPVVAGEEEKGSQLPLKIRLLPTA
ncbi:cytochrome P450 [Sistotremastrum suecicum HHB10207 ss-3]|uniref:Cytochrome P450 n=1 Tax=Sistotremastrum suecicum HHB10207 ss-3 TaxID=1314776 RepID=A0A166H4D8_9AGAM|nr:cytochrome P450 [Sistotremastrum suecicum HHB10207 ss-3]